MTTGETAHRWRFSRRGMLGGTVGAAGLAALGQGVRGAWSAATRQATPTSAVTGAELTDPPVLRSTNGRLDVALEANYGPAAMGGTNGHHVQLQRQRPRPDPAHAGG